MATCCPVCCGTAELRGNGTVGPHTDGAGKLCVMVGRVAPPWDERATRESVRGRSANICEFCSSQRATDMHHRMSRGVGGAWSPANIAHLCRQCHSWVTEHPAWAHTMGLIVKSHEDPEECPLIRNDGTVVYLTDLVTTKGPRG